MSWLRKVLSLLMVGELSPLGLTSCCLQTAWVAMPRGGQPECAGEGGCRLEQRDPGESSGKPAYVLHDQFYYPGRGFFSLVASGGKTGVP